MQDSAKGSRKIYTYFQMPAIAGTGGSQTERTAWISSDQRRNLERESAIKTLDKKLYHNSYALNKQSLIRHQAVLAFLQA